MEPATEVCALTRGRNHNLLVYGTTLQSTKPPVVVYFSSLSGPSSQKLIRAYFNNEVDEIDFTDRIDEIYIN